MAPHVVAPPSIPGTLCLSVTRPLRLRGPFAVLVLVLVVLGLRERLY